MEKKSRKPYLLTKKREVWTEEEQQKWDALDKEIKNIDKTIDAEKRAIEMNGKKKDHGKAGSAAETEEERATREAEEERAFEDYILGNTENRATGEYNLSADKKTALKREQ